MKCDVMRESRVATDALISQLMVQFIGILYAQNLAKCWYFERLFGFLSQEKKKKVLNQHFQHKDSISALHGLSVLILIHWCIL